MSNRAARRLAATIFSIALSLFTVFTLLDTLVIPHRYATVVPAGAASQSVDATTAGGGTTSSGGTDPSGGTTSGTTTSTGGTASGTTTSPQVSPTQASLPAGATISGSAQTYSDASRTIRLTTYRLDNTNVYVADIVVADPSVVKRAFAQGTYGRNVTETTSQMASENSAILAVNGDFYGARTSGYVVMDGTVYRSQAASSSQQDLAIMADGSWQIITEGQVSAADLVAQGATDVLCFGPGLVENGDVIVDANSEVDRSMASNPRTALAQVGPLHYLFVVADGRTSASAGLSLEQLADFLVGLGATTAYNLDGGGSSTLWFQGNVVNQHTTDGRTITQRKVSDIVYI